MYNILLVEDDPFIIEITSIFLERTGSFSVTGVLSVNEAEKIFSKNKFDAIVSDYQMPLEKGTSFLKKLRAQGIMIPFIIFSGKCREEIIIEALNSGADGYVQKGSDTKSQFAELSHTIMQAILKKDATTEQKKIEEKLETEEGWFKSIFDSLLSGVIIIDAKNHKIIDVNPAASSLIDLPPEKIIGKICHQFICPVEKGRCPITDLGQKIDKSRRILINSRNEQVQIFKSVNKVKFDSSEYLIENLIDITDRTRMESEIKIKNKAIESSINAILICNPDGSICYANRSFLDMWGFDDINGILKKSINDFIGDNSYSEENLNNYLHKDRSIGKKKDGTVFPIHISISVIRDNNGKTMKIMASIIDISKIKKAENDLRDETERLETTLRSIGDGVIVTDRDGNIRIINRKAEELFGLSENEAKGKQIKEIVSVLDKKSSGLLESEIKKCLVSGENTQELNFRLFSAGNNRDFILNTQISPLIDESHIPSGAVIVLHDITEILKYQNALEIADKKRKLMGSTLRHDVLNQIAGISGYCELLKESSIIKKDSREAGYMKQIEIASEKVKSHFSFSKSYDSIGIKSPIWHDLDSTFINQAYTFSGERVNFISDTKGAEIYADPMLERVFYNLIDNSIRHGGGVSEIKLSFKQNQDTGVILYEDNGQGISDDISNKIFVKGFGRNSGNGLFLIQEILHITGIGITLGKSDKGAAFEITVPERAYQIRDEEPAVNIRFNNEITPGSV